MLMVVAPGKDAAKRRSCLSALFLPLQETKADVSADEELFGTYRGTDTEREGQYQYL